MRALLPFILSLIIPGLGQFYYRDYLKGVIMLFLLFFTNYFLSFIPVLVIYACVFIWSQFDLFFKTEKREDRAVAIKCLAFSFIILIFIVPATVLLIEFTYSTGSEYMADNYLNEDYTRREMQEISQQLDRIKHTHKKFPDDFETFIHSKPIWKSWASDYWGNNYQYSLTDSVGYTLSSAGRDGTFSTEDDLIIEKGK